MGYNIIPWHRNCEMCELERIDAWNEFWKWLPEEDQNRISDKVRECVNQINAELEASGLTLEDVQKLLTEDVPPFEVYG